MTKPTKVTPAQAHTMVSLRDQKAPWGRKGFNKSCGHCTLGFNKETQQWTMGAYWNEKNEDGSWKYEEGRMVRQSFRTSHRIAFEGFGPEAMERLNAHWKGFCLNNNIEGRY